MTSAERQLEQHLLEKLHELKYKCRADIRDRTRLEQNFRKEFDTLNHVRLIDGEFKRLLDEAVTADDTLRNRNRFTRDDGTRFNFALVNIASWCKNTFVALSLLRINTDFVERLGFIGPSQWPQIIPICFFPGRAIFECVHL